MKILFLLITVFSAVPVHAYLGPGLGTGALSVVLGFIASIFLALFAIFWFPVKRLIKKKKKPKPGGTGTEGPESGSGEK